MVGLLSSVYVEGLEVHSTARNPSFLPPTTVWWHRVTGSPNGNSLRWKIRSSPERIIVTSSIWCPWQAEVACSRLAETGFILSSHMAV